MLGFTLRLPQVQDGHKRLVSETHPSTRHIHLSAVPTQTPTHAYTRQQARRGEQGCLQLMALPSFKEHQGLTLFQDTKWLPQVCVPPAEEGEASVELCLR